jgi:hypothetical protein
MFLYSTVSTLKPIVGIVVTISPSFNLYKIVVLPAASRPTIKILISDLPKRPLKSCVNTCPILKCFGQTSEEYLLQNNMCNEIIATSAILSWRRYSSEV